VLDSVDIYRFFLLVWSRIEHLTIATPGGTRLGAALAILAAYSRALDAFDIGTLIC
jgi:hypothetical protein